MHKFSEEQLRWYSAIGYLTTCWAAAETTLDSIISAVDDGFGGKDIEPNPPISVSQKGAYLRKAFGAHPALRPHYERMDEVLHEAARLADMRHWAVHNSLLERPELDEDMAAIFKYAGETTYQPDRKFASPKEIDKTALDCAVLALNLFYLGCEAVGIISEDHMSKIPGNYMG
ncbi:hypothetical protein GR183_12440 [Stappia sp. GBMRC 2046]|uniref:Uncharacterized protein n=1 Tax=Stappia sediminis TaxID=2692190 RepID=A0A7X3S8F9_9HYPH|nr:hypothetical protein [Stappia sediminis]MXN65715.1 hypothetical protein [Stappia sediminis]